MTRGTFDAWHQKAVGVMCSANYRGKHLNVGQSAKAIAIYLKTVCYLSGYGREELRSVIHPPFDRRLMDQLGLEGDVYLWRYTEYEARVVEAHRIASEKGCSPIELEQFWRPD